MYVCTVYYLCYTTACHVHAVPEGPPLSVSVTAGTAASITISWSPPDLALQNGQITSYKLLYTTDNSQQEDMRPSITTNANTFSYLLTSLQFSTHYQISIAASTSIGFGPYARKSIVTLSSDLNPLALPPPSDIKVGSVQDKTITFAWSTVTSATEYRVISLYMLYTIVYYHTLIRCTTSQLRPMKFLINHMIHQNNQTVQ